MSFERPSAVVAAGVRWNTSTGVSGAKSFEVGAELRNAVESVRSDADYDSSISVLRVIDIVVWNLDG